jgi:hypothetical protein
MHSDILITDEAHSVTPEDERRRVRVRQLIESAYAPRGHAKGNPGRREIAAACAGAFLPSRIAQPNTPGAETSVWIGRTHAAAEIAQWFEEHGLVFFDPKTQTSGRLPPGAK